MRIIFRLLTVAILILGLFVVPVPTYAQQFCGGCQVGTKLFVDPETGESFYIDGCNNCYATPCESGSYQAPNGECYPVGQGGCQCGVKANGACKDCGAAYSCDWTKLNCPSGTVKDTTQVTSTYCGLVTGCPAPGSAQAKIAPGCGHKYCGNQVCRTTPSGKQQCDCTVWLYGRQTIRTYRCTPIVSACVPSAPAAPTLNSPADGDTLAGENVTLLWSGGSWGAGTKS